MFHLWWKENFVKHRKVSKYEPHCLQNLLLLFMLLLTTKFVKNSQILPRIFFIFLKNVLKQTWNSFNTKFQLSFNNQISVKRLRKKLLSKANTLCYVLKCNEICDTFWNELHKFTTSPPPLTTFFIFVITWWDFEAVINPFMNKNHRELSNWQSLFHSCFRVPLTKSNFGFGTAVFNTLPGIMSFNLSAKSWKSGGRFWGCTNEE